MFNTLRNAATASASRLSAGVQHRWTMCTLDRFSDHRLHDLGFERDWDGTVIPIPTASNAIAPRAIEARGSA